IEAIDAVAHARFLREVVGISRVDRERVLDLIAKAEAQHVTVLIGNAGGAIAIGDGRAVIADPTAQRERRAYVIDRADRAEHTVTIALLDRNKETLAAEKVAGLKRAPLRPLELAAEFPGGRKDLGEAERAARGKIDVRRCVLGSKAERGESGREEGIDR